MSVRPTIADVARRAGVSTAAVSFAVNGRPGVGEATRARILTAAEELGWRPSARARALTSARTGAIGLVLFRDAAQLEADAFFVRFLAGIEETLAAVDAALLLQVCPPADGDAALAAYDRMTAEGRVDGVIVCDVRVGDPRFAFLRQRAIPVVVAGRPPADSGLTYVETEHAQGVADAVGHLVDLGHRRVAFLAGAPELEHVASRRARWAGALAAARLALGPEAYAAAPAAVVGAADALLDRSPTAVVCTSDVLALAVVAAARARGLAVPGALSVCGFDDSSLATFADPPLTSVRVDYADFGRAAAAALLARIADEPTPRWRPARPQLLVRGSTAPPRPGEAGSCRRWR